MMSTLLQILVERMFQLSENTCNFAEEDSKEN